LPSCATSPDVLIVRDGSDSTSPVLAVYCNTLNGETVISTGSSLHVELVTDGRGQRQGFAAVYSFFLASDVIDSSTGSSTPGGGFGGERQPLVSFALSSTTTTMPFLPPAGEKHSGSHLFELFPTKRTSNEGKTT